MIAAVDIRKLLTVCESVHREGGQAVEPATRIVAALAVISNPLSGRWTDDLDELSAEYSPRLGELLARTCLDLLDAPAQGFGKGALVGSAGEIEHGSAILHTLRFGDEIRTRLDATSFLPSVEKRGATGASMDIPLKHVKDVTQRGHHQSFEVSVPDAPAPDEIVVALALASGPRPQSRLRSLEEERAAGASA